jgi:ribonuclease R
VENKSLELIKNLGNIENPKIDELISLHLYNETFRLEKHLEVTANMDDTKQRLI